MRYTLPLAIVIIFLSGFQSNPQQQFDTILLNGWVYDGSGDKPFVADIAIRGDTIAAIGNLKDAAAGKRIDISGLAIAPGFINMLSWADLSLLKDGSGMSDIKQGVTLEVFGEGWSPGPVKRNVQKPVDSLWTTLDGYFKWALKNGVTPNIASFVGATTVRIHELGHANRAPTAEELKRMKALVKQAMEEGAMGLGTSLIYAPADYATTEEIIELAKVASAYGGMYTTHMRSEGDHILRALKETFRIAREAKIPVEIYHLKISMMRNWKKIDTVLFRIDSARNAGLKITANAYPYVASSTSLTVRLPNWAQEGGAKEMRKRLRNPAMRKKVLYEMRMGIPSKNSDPVDVMLLDFRLDSLDQMYAGKRLNEVARIHGKDADETVIDLILTDKSPIAAVYFLQLEENVKKIVGLPFVSFGSDAPALSEHPAFSTWSTHPRAYGTFARVLRKYVREEQLMPLEEAIRKMTSLPATNLKIQKRGSLKVGYYADLAIFDADSIYDHATFEEPKKYATGVVHVFVNGVQVLNDGMHTGARPGRAVRGPGYQRKKINSR